MKTNAPKPSSAGADTGLRLNKAIAQAGLASRRAADAMIQEGRVAVNGVVVTEPGTRIDPAADAVTVDGAPLSKPATQSHAYLLCNKPVQVVSTARDPQGRRTVVDLLPRTFAGLRLYPVGRLDYFSEGLLLLTDDGEMTLRLTHPRYHLPKTYRVTVREEPSRAMLETMRRGMTLAEGEKLAPVEARLLPGKGFVLEMVLNQGINRQIRRMCRDLGLTILRLVRTDIGPLHLGDLAPGAVRELSQNELTALKKAVGLRSS
ncbi:putative enzyme [uncultured delta proteobacterium]|uniref:Pseudouridine synthase n=1 Tax=uncultured delta proteobacterium TaxID=34034 RepID=A0A212J364_9DELT|nr:putative enzyme [uncultured delta proteobacterium]